MPYQTAGDWKIDQWGNITASCAHLPGMDASVTLVMCHEVIEAILCRHLGISEQSVTDFDTSHLELDEPGDSPHAPYNAAHMAAMDLERRLCEYMNLPWEQHEQNVAQIADAVDIALQSKTSDAPPTHDLLLP